MIERLAVVVPARDEAQRVLDCLDSIQRAALGVDVPVDIYLVADSCADNTAALARGFGGVTVIEIDSGTVGTARAAGALAAVLGGADWLAFTDADSTVPAHWLSTHVRFANLGYDCLIGTVRPNSHELSLEQLRRWRRTHVGGRAIGHVHGANLGVRAEPYLAVGGFRDLAEHEDVDLIDRMQPWLTVATDACEVTTSARAVGRTPGGYASYLSEQGLAAG